MKKILSSLLFTFILISGFGSVSAQTISVSSVSSSSVCSGDQLSVTFAVTGLWQHRNAFTLQLSNANGGFTSGFTNLASMVDTLPGTFTLSAKISAGPASHYRVRVIGALPYVTSADNGSDIAVHALPQDPRNTMYMTYATTDSTLHIWASINPGIDTVFWNFGAGAHPQFDTIIGKQSDTVRFVTPGVRNVSYKIGTPCGYSSTATIPLAIFDCSSPAIPNTAKVIDHDMHIVDSQWYNHTTHRDSATVFWVNPGVRADFSAWPTNTIFAESGSTIKNVEGAVIYMKPGVALEGYTYSNVFIHSYSGSDTGAFFQLSCPTLNFDYTNAPPNSIMGTDAVRSLAPEPMVSIAPNPSAGVVTITGIPDRSDVTILDMLGKSIYAVPQGATSFDITNMASGTYYVRIANAAMVITKKIVKE